MVGEALAAGGMMVLPVAGVLALRLHSLWGLGASALLVPFTAALVMLLPVGMSLLVLRLLPPRRRLWAPSLASLLFPLGLFLLLPQDTNPARPVRWPNPPPGGDIPGADRTPLPRGPAPAPDHDVDAGLAVAMALSALSRSLTHLQATPSHARIPSRPTGATSFLAADAHSRRQNLLPLWLFNLVSFSCCAASSPKSGVPKIPGRWRSMYIGSVSMIGLGVFLRERKAAVLPYLWPMPLGHFWRERTLWLLR